ncbi:hypothetical protein TTHERM_01085510 (macronuclear) [Tetrahymena thermophila SB210]|uniref:Kinase domain protein n=1 Tax=Tetrahymena thermophila (strain SB210) TaxID=312017 RepID=Q22BR9_TETTS|nr:hypothetical protein TTHERM_01085510 [Tetrahymena thermophila SB210]EAR82720.3 hypothetical protein TTHERM_01085510 [Tetrahymena thermophila SB210]|eukprot:XP_001030383.3 hypothetical protein TTHERM_01085510 [Tetrahymena thermophila SB210]
MIHRDKLFQYFPQMEELNTWNRNKVINDIMLDLYSEQVGFEDNDEEQILAKLQELSQPLKTFYLLLSGDNSKFLRPILTKLVLSLKSITYLNLLLKENKNIDVQFLRSKILQFQKLRYLCMNLNFTDIGAQGLQALFEAFGQLEIEQMHFNFQGMGINNNSFGIEYIKGELLREFKLNLRQNKIGYVGCTHLVKALQKMKNLLTLKLDLGDNPIKNKGASVLFHGLQHFNQLIKLKVILNRTNIENEGLSEFDTCFNQIGQNLDILVLDFGSNKITNREAMHIVKSVSLCQNLTQLDLCFKNNYLQPKVGEEIKRMLQCMNKLISLRLNLKSFHLSNQEDDQNPENCIGQIGASEIAKGLQHLKHLRILDIGLKGNHVMNTGITEISSVIAKVKSLEKFQINLAGNQLTDAALIQLSFDLANQQDLKYLHIDLGWNMLHFSNCFEALSNTLKRLNNLETFNLSINHKNKIYSDSIENLIPGIKSLQNLKNFSLNVMWCKIKIRGLQLVSDAIAHHPQLISLDLNLGGCQICDKGMLYLKNGLSQLINLKKLVLNLYHNNLTDQGAEEIGQALEKMPKIQMLNIELNWNNIGDEGAGRLAKVIEQKGIKNFGELKISLRNSSVSQQNEDEFKQYFEKFQEENPFSQNIDKLHEIKEKYVCCSGQFFTLRKIHKKEPFIFEPIIFYGINNPNFLMSAISKIAKVMNQNSFVLSNVFDEKVLRKVRKNTFQIYEVKGDYQLQRASQETKLINENALLHKQNQFLLNQNKEYEKKIKELQDRLYMADEQKRITYEHIESLNTQIQTLNINNSYHSNSSSSLGNGNITNNTK